MRFGLSLAVLGALLASAMPVHAQQQQQQQPSYVYGGSTPSAPLYNSTGNYTTQTNGGSFYNSGANLQMLPMQQMVAGKNAPSYSYRGGQGQVQPYNYNSAGMLDPSMMGSLSPEQARMARDQRNANAAAYQQQYLEQLRQRDMNNPYAVQQQDPNMMNGASQYQGAQFSQLYANSDQPKPQVKRKVLYNQLNNPLVEPPKLFNTD